MQAPSRSELARTAGELIKKGSKAKADLTEVDLGQGPIVVKDFGARPLLGRLLGRVQIARECAAYRWLGSAEGIPHFLGKIDAHALAVEKIDGLQLIQAGDRLQAGPAYLEQIRRILDGFHAAGLAHLDLRCRENVVVDAGGRVFLLDLASAVWLRPGGWAHRLFFSFLRTTDHSAYLKWKQLLQAGAYSPEEQAFLDRHRFWRSLWPFNRKRRKTAG